MDEQSMTIGEYLKQSRQKQGIDLEDISRELHIRVQYLKALEADQWDQLPGEVYAIGFLKSYARQLNLDAEALVSYHKRLVASREPVHPEATDRSPVLHPSTSHVPLSEPGVPQRRRPKGSKGTTGSPMAVIGAAVALAALLIIGLVLMRGPDHHASTASSPPIARSKAPRVPLKHKKPKTVKKATAPPVPEVSVKEISNNPQLGLATYDVSASALNMHLAFSGPCWVEVWENGVSQGASGITYQAGQSVSISASQSVAVKVGTRAVVVSVNGQSVTLPDPNIYPLVLTFQRQ